MNCVSCVSFRFRVGSDGEKDNISMMIRICGRSFKIKIWNNGLMIANFILLHFKFISQPGTRIDATTTPCNSYEMTRVIMERLREAESISNDVNNEKLLCNF